MLIIANEILKSSKYILTLMVYSDILFTTKPCNFEEKKLKGLLLGYGLTETCLDLIDNRFAEERRIRFTKF